MRPATLALIDAALSRIRHDPRSLVSMTNEVAPTMHPGVSSPPEPGRAGAGESCAPRLARCVPCARRWPAWLVELAAEAPMGSEQ
jgi:hypothetical protein